LFSVDSFSFPIRFVDLKKRIPSIAPIEYSVAQLLLETAIHAQETQKTASRSGCKKKVTTTAENHLAALPEKGKNLRVASFACVNFVLCRETHPKICK